MFHLTAVVPAEPAPVGHAQQQPQQQRQTPQPWPAETRPSTLTINTSGSIDDATSTTLTTAGGHDSPLPLDYTLLQQLIHQRQTTFHTVHGTGPWKALLRCVRPVRFQDPALEEQYQRFAFVSTHSVEKSYHVLALVLCGLAALHEMTRQGSATKFVGLGCSVAMVIVSCFLVWRKDRTRAIFSAIVALDASAFVVYLVLTSMCNDWVSSAECVSLRHGVLSGAHFIACIECMLVFAFGLNLQVPYLFCAVSLYFVVWAILCLSLYPFAVLSTLVLLGGLFSVVAVVCAQAHQRHVSHRMQFHMVMELSRQVHDKHQGMKDLEVAHREALSAQAKAVRATTARHIHESIMGYTCHQLRNPLHSLRGILEPLRKRCTLHHTIDAGDVESLQLMDDSATQLAKVADDVLDFQKLQNGTFSHKPAVVDVRTILETAVRPMRDLTTVAIHVDVGSDVPATVFADAQRVAQMLHIGISNALKHHKPNSALRVSCKPASGDETVVQFEVWNEGQGLGTLDIQSLFRPYERSLKEGEVLRGVGLGLPISLLLARLLGGSVGLEDRGRYTVYWFTIPTVGSPTAPSTPVITRSPSLIRGNSFGGGGPSSPYLVRTASQLNQSPYLQRGNSTAGSRSNSLSFQAPTPPRPGTATSGSSVVVQVPAELTAECPWTYWGRIPDNLSPPMNIMVVDDLRTNRRLLLAMLARLGHQVAELEDGDEIPNALHEGRVVDVLMLDIHMVRSDGRDICRFLREQGHMFPIIAVTGNVAASDIVSYQAAGFDGVLGKPFTSHHVCAVLKLLTHGPPSR